MSSEEEKLTRTRKNEDIQDEIFKEERRERNKKFIKKLLKYTLLFVVFFYVFFLYNSNISAGSFIVKEERIIDRRIPDSFNGVKIIQFSDLHYGSNIDDEKLDKIINLINERHPDLVLFTGDLITKDREISNEEQQELIAKLKTIKANLGKYSILGDEDKDLSSTILYQSDFMILDNDYDLIYNNKNEAILLSGFSSSLNKKIDVNKALSYYSIEGSNNDIYSIGMMHEADNTTSILKTHSTDLLLAGHSHNGDIRIPYIGTIFKKEGSKKYDQAFYKLNNSSLYISSCLGTQGDGVRLFSKPSINFFRISNF